MTPGSGKRVPPPVLAADRMALLALRSLGDYAPLNLAYNCDSLIQLEAALAQAEDAEIMARRALEVAREQATLAGQLFHSGMLNAKSQVIAQYGSDSPAVHAVGLKQKSERKRPLRRTPAQPSPRATDGN
jgi:hypothetical protein